MGGTHQQRSPSPLAWARACRVSVRPARWLLAQVCLGKVGAVAAREVSRFARNNRDWQQLIEMCRVVDTVLVDQETVSAPRHGNDRLLLSLKGSLNEYELDLLRQRSLAARYEKARGGRTRRQRAGGLRQGG